MATAQAEAIAPAEVEGDLAHHTTATGRDATKAMSTPILQAAGIRNANARIGTAAGTGDQIGSGTVIVVVATVAADAAEDDVTMMVAGPIGEVVAISLTIVGARVAGEAEMAAEMAAERVVAADVGAETTSTRRCAVSGAEPRRQYRLRSASRRPT